jgi:hypothetical protein
VETAAQGSLTRLIFRLIHTAKQNKPGSGANSAPESTRIPHHAQEPISKAALFSHPHLSNEHCRKVSSEPSMTSARAASNDRMLARKFVVVGFARSVQTSAVQCQVVLDRHANIPCTTRKPRRPEMQPYNPTGRQRSKICRHVRYRFQYRHPHFQVQLLANLLKPPISRRMHARRSKIRLIPMPNR